MPKENGKDVANSLSEYSNTINFTHINIIMYLGIIPVFCTLIYWIICKLESINWGSRSI